MALTGLKLTTPPNQLSFLKPSASHLTSAKFHSFQVRCKGDPECEASKSLSLSRRDAMICLTTLSSTVIGISAPEIAEARVKRDDIRRKIKEKLQMLREKAGLSKQKQNDEGKSLPDSTKKGSKLPLEPSPLPLPAPPQGLNKSLVEANI